MNNEMNWHLPKPEKCRKVLFVFQSQQPAKITKVSLQVQIYGDKEEIFSYEKPHPSKAEAKKEKKRGKKKSKKRTICV